MCVKSSKQLLLLIIFNFPHHVVSLCFFITTCTVVFLFLIHMIAKFHHVLFFSDCKTVAVHVSSKTLLCGLVVTFFYFE
jgi:hypothetical protein